jgi:hypothetical protein
MKRFTLLVGMLLLPVLTASCGYRFSGEGTGPQPGLNTIAIPVFENTTSEPELGAIFAAELRRQFMEKGPMRVVPMEHADAVIKGRIVDLHTQGVAHRSFERRFDTKLSVESRIYVTVDVRCEDGQKGKILWRDPAFSYYKVYRENPDPRTPDPVVNFDSRRLALETIAHEMAVRIHDRILNNF